MTAMGCWEYPQAKLVPSGVTTGSVNVEHEPRLVMSHAVVTIPRHEPETIRYGDTLHK
jgi:hypothetical protein